MRLSSCIYQRGSIVATDNIEKNSLVGVYFCVQNFSFSTIFINVPNMISTASFVSPSQIAFTTSITEINTKYATIQLTRTDLYESWAPETVLINYYVWDVDPQTDSSKSGMVYVAPTGVNSLSSITIGFDEAFNDIPVVIASVTCSGDMNVYGLTTQQVYQNYAVLNLYGAKPWTCLMVISWRAWGPDQTNLIVGSASIGTCPNCNQGEIQAISTPYSGPCFFSAPGILAMARMEDATSTNVFATSIGDVQQCSFTPGLEKIFNTGSTTGWTTISDVDYVAWNNSEIDCFVNENGLCNGEGVCNNGDCSCYNGWNGANCTACDDNFYGVSCLPCDGFDGSSACHARGTCNGTATHSGDGSCTCDVGYNSLYGCGNCSVGYYYNSQGENCTLCPALNGEICSGNGYCLIVSDQG